MCLSYICLLAMYTLICVTVSLLLVSGVGCDFRLWLFLDFSVYFLGRLDWDEVGLCGDVDVVG